MKPFVLGTVLFSVVCVGAALATTTDELMFSTGGKTATISPTATCSGSGCGGLTEGMLGGNLEVVGTIGNWTIQLVTGDSHSPSLNPYGIQLNSETASCSGGCMGANALDVQFSDITFNTTSPGLTASYSDTPTGTGSTSQNAYFSTGNSLFAETTLIGSLGPFTTSTGGTVTGPGPSSQPYSLTLDQIFSSGCNCATFDAHGNITAVPEPASMVLFGTLLALPLAFRRRFLR